MKIRNAFVSNSSSSSFVIILPENIDEIIENKKDEIPIILNRYFDINKIKDVIGDDEPKEYILNQIKMLTNDIKKYGQVEYIHEYDCFECATVQVLSDIISYEHRIFEFDARPDGGEILFITKEYAINKISQLK